MKIKKTKLLITFFAIIFIILYILLSAHPLAKEYQFTPVWTITPDTMQEEKIRNTEDKIFFKLGQTLGYFTDTGKLTLYRTFPSKATISDNYYSIYSTENDSTIIYDNEGYKIGTIDEAGFPFLTEDRIYNFLPGGSSFSYNNKSGTTQWTIESTIPVTAFTSNSNFTAAGYADGSINVINNAQGTTSYEFVPGGSDFPVILGLDISENGKYIACICGHDKQRFLIAENDSERIRIIYHKYIDSDTNHRTLINICSDNNTVYSIFDNNLNIFDIDKKKSKNIPIDSRILDIKETDLFIYLLGKKDNNYTVYAVDKTNTLISNFSFTAENAFITTYKNNLFVGKDNNISKFQITKE